ncbi:MAG TPA: hypothetical protein VK915_08625 [Gaiellaceae bacterium]|nr:hypothetical protein [Gaiellaceae bacterium]
MKLIVAKRNEPRCSICKSGRREDFDAYLKRYLNKEPDETGRKLTWPRLTEVSGIMLGEKLSERSIRRHLDGHCEVVTDEARVVALAAQADKADEERDALLDEIDGLLADGGDVSPHGLSLQMRAYLLDLRKRIAAGERPQLTHDAAARAAERLMAAQKRGEEAKLLAALTGGIEKAFSRSGFASLSPSEEPDEIVVEPEEVEERVKRLGTSRFTARLWPLGCVERCAVLEDRELYSDCSRPRPPLDMGRLGISAFPGIRVGGDHLGRGFGPRRLLRLEVEQSRRKRGGRSLGAVPCGGHAFYRTNRVIDATQYQGLPRATTTAGRFGNPETWRCGNALRTAVHPPKAATGVRGLSPVARTSAAKSAHPQVVEPFGAAATTSSRGVSAPVPGGASRYSRNSVLAALNPPPGCGVADREPT